MSEKKNNILIKLLAPLIVIALFGGLCIAGLFGGSGNLLPAEEDTATEYQMIGGQMHVNWQWIMLIDMFLAQMEDQLDILQQNPVYTVLNCLQVEIKVYDYDYDPETQTGKWEYDYTDYANGAEEILSYFNIPADTKDINVIVRAISSKNSDEFQVSIEPYASIEDVLSNYYSFPEDILNDIISLSESNYLAEAFGLAAWTGSGGIFEGAVGDFGELPEIGMQIPLYYQYQSPWGKIKFGDGNIASSGCSITCLAMVISYLTSGTVTPDELAAWAGNRFHVPDVGQGWDIFPAVARKYGVNCVGLGESMNNVINALKSEKPVIASMTAGTFTKKGHFIVLRGIDENGKILVNDPNDNDNKRHFYRSFEIGLIKREAKQFWCFD